MYGEIFKQLRTKKQYSIIAISDEYVSKSTISRFENEESDIGFSKVLHLLKKINVSLEEYEYNLSTAIINKKNNISKLVLSKDTKQLKKIIDTISSNKDLDYSDKLTLIVLKNQFNQLSNEMTYTIDSDYLANYLFMCEHWSYSEIILFANTLNLFTPEAINMFTEEIIVKLPYFEDQRHIYETAINTIENSIFILVQHGDIVKSAHLLDVLNKLELDETFMLENNILLFLNGVLKTLKKEEAGKTLIVKSLRVFELLGANGFLNIFKDYLTSIKINLEQKI